MFIITATLYSQNQDSLLEKIQNIDISLDEPITGDEDLYMNTVSFQSFYDVLSPMGEWIQITKEDIDDDLSDGDGEGISSFTSGLSEEEFLFIWKPSVETNWKPYVNGKWEYSDHGWLWVTSDKWGNSTYNYGRWWNSPKYGWVWLPGYTWAPAWVKWKVTNDDKYVGWVALSPKAKWNSDKGITEETYKFRNKDKDWIFVENNSFGTDITPGNIVKQDENSSLVKNSISITDLKTEDDRIVNKGPDVNRMEEKTGRKFQRKKLKFAKGNVNVVVGDNDIVIGKIKLDRHNGQKEQISKPHKFKKSDRVKGLIKRWKNRNHPPMKH
ncbi:MAG: DUF6600 domain-containing protein [Ignavibacteria bacterium]